MTASDTYTEHINCDKATLVQYIFSTCFMFDNETSNSNWTEWSTIQGVNAQVIPKSDEREARTTRGPVSN